MKNLLGKLGGFLGGLVPKALIMGFAKSAAKKLIQKQGDWLENELVKALKEQGPKHLDHVIDKSQAILIAKIQMIPLIPARIKELITKPIQEKGDELQQNIKKEIESRGEEAIRENVDKLQETLKALIDRL